MSVERCQVPLVVEGMRRAYDLAGGWLSRGGRNHGPTRFQLEVSPFSWIPEAGIAEGGPEGEVEVSLVVGWQ